VVIAGSSYLTADGFKNLELALFSVLACLFYCAKVVLNMQEVLMRFALIVILFLVEACVSNPYDDHRLTTEKESQKYPEQAEHIRQQHDEWANRTRLNRGPNDSYIVEQEKVSGSAFGGPNAAIHLGSNTYKYHHKINLTLVCEKDAFIPKPYSKKNIKWKFFVL
jgi:hypothetical protein